MFQPRDNAASGCKTCALSSLLTYISGFRAYIQISIQIRISGSYVMACRSYLENKFIAWEKRFDYRRRVAVQILSVGA